MMDASSLFWHIGELGAVIGGAYIMGKMLAERVGKLEDRLDKAVESVRADIRAVHSRIDSTVANVIPFRPSREREGA